MSDGLVERLNRTIQQMLTNYVNENRSDWEDHLPYICMAYRASVQDTTGCTPNLLMLGREISLPIDLLLGQPPFSPEPQCTTQYVEWLKSAMQKAFDYARERMKFNVVRQKRNYNKKVNSPDISQGDWVWLYDNVRSKLKLGKGWCGPWLVVRILSEVTFLIQREEHSNTRVVHRNSITKYTSQSEPVSWLPKNPSIQNSTQHSKSVQTDIAPTNTRRCQTDNMPHKSVVTQTCELDIPERQSSRVRRPRRPYSPD